MPSIEGTRFANAVRRINSSLVIGASMRYHPTSHIVRVPSGAAGFLRSAMPSVREQWKSAIPDIQASDRLRGAIAGDQVRIPGSEVHIPSPPAASTGREKQNPPLAGQVGHQAGGAARRRRIIYRQEQSRYSRGPSLVRSKRGGGLAVDCALAGAPRGAKNLTTRYTAGATPGPR